VHGPRIYDDHAAPQSAEDVVFARALEVRHRHRRRPAFFEKIYAKLMEQGSKATGLKRKLLTGRSTSQGAQPPGGPARRAQNLILKAQWVSPKLVYKKSAPHRRKIAYGFLRWRAAIKDLAEFFWSIAFRFTRATA